MGMGKLQRSRPQKNHHVAIKIPRRREQRSHPKNHMKNHLPESSNIVVEDKPAGGPAKELPRCEQRIHPKNHMKNHLPESSNIVVEDNPGGGPAAKDHLLLVEHRSPPKNYSRGGRNTVIEIHVKDHLLLVEHRSPPKNYSRGRRNTVIEIPRALYNCIQAELASRKEWKAKRDHASKLKLENNQILVEKFKHFYTHFIHVLPLGWRYNSVTASTFVPTDEHPSPLPSFSWLPPPAKEMTNASEDKDDTYPYPPDDRYELPNIYNVPLKEDETQSWLQFKKLDEGNPTPVPTLIDEGNKFPSNINIEHPFVSVIGSFAFNGFNEAYKMFVSKGKHSVLSDPAYRECTYLRSYDGNSYWLNITIEAVENRFCCIYEAIVKCNVDNGERTLMEFSATEKKQAGKKEVRASKSESSKDEDDVREPSPPRTKVSKELFEAYANIRMKRNIFGGYDYEDPYN